MEMYLSYFLEVYKEGQLYTYVYPTTLFSYDDEVGVYKHLLEVISQKFDELPESDGSLSLSELESIYELDLSSKFNKGVTNPFGTRWDAEVRPMDSTYHYYYFIIYEVGVPV